MLRMGARPRIEQLQLLRERILEGIGFVNGLIALLDPGLLLLVRHGFGGPVGLSVAAGLIVFQLVDEVLDDVAAELHVRSGGGCAVGRHWGWAGEQAICGRRGHGGCSRGLRVGRRGGLWPVQGESYRDGGADDDDGAGGDREPGVRGSHGESIAARGGSSQMRGVGWVRW